MDKINGLTISICTRNRFSDLCRCVTSIAGQKLDGSFAVEVLIVDDGDLTGEQIDQLKSCFSSNIAFYYEKKRDHGLLLSRIKTVSLAHYDIILFLDDDVAFADGSYLNQLIRTYRDHPDCSGVGGIDRSLGNSKITDFFARLILLNSGHVGKLSLSGYTGSMYLWHYFKGIFPTEFLHGCNMSFDRRAIRAVPSVAWLDSYSLGEDVFLSHIAATRGKLYINPALKVDHYHSPTARDKMEEVAFSEVVNHRYLLEYQKASPFQYLSQIWTVCGLLFISLIRHQEKVRGYLRGLWFILGKKKSLPDR